RKQVQELKLTVIVNASLLLCKHPQWQIVVVLHCNGGNKIKILNFNEYNAFPRVMLPFIPECSCFYNFHKLLYPPVQLYTISHRTGQVGLPGNIWKPGSSLN